MSAIEHVVVLMMENRSFDEYFGTFPGAAGFTDDPPSKQPWPSPQREFLYPWRLSTFTTNALHAPILTHDWITNHVAIGVNPNSGTPSNTEFYTSSVGNELVMGCYLADDIPYFWALAQAFALCDQYFCSVLSGTVSNRMFLTGGTITDPSMTPPTSGIYQGSQDGGQGYKGTDPILYNFSALPPPSSGPNVPGIASLDTLPQWGSYLADLRHSSPDGSLYRVYDDWNWQFDWSPSTMPNPVSDLDVFYYYQPYQTPSGQMMLGTPDDPNYFAPNYTSNAIRTPNDCRPLFAQHVYPADSAQPFLAPLTWIHPPYLYSDHPNFTSADASYYVAQIVDALMGSQFWENTVLIITYDESNTHFDHLPPPLSPDPQQVPDGPFEPWVQDGSGMGKADGFSGYPADMPAPIGAGMRVPTIIVSPWTYQRGIVSAKLDHSSILQLMETVSGVTCSGLPALGSVYSWRRANFGNLHDVIDPGNAQVTPAQQITGLPTARPTVAQWRTNANIRYMNKSGVSPSPLTTPQAGPPAMQQCTVMLTSDFYDGASVLAQAPGGSAVTFPDAVTVTVSGFQAQEFVELNAGVPPPLVPTNLTEVPVAGGPGTCWTRVPVLQVVSGGSPNEITIGSCSQVNADPNLSTGDQDPQDFMFTFPLTFNYPLVTFAFRKGTARVLGLQAVFTVDACVTATAQLTLADGTVVRQPPEVCMVLADQILNAERAVYAASQASGPGSADQLHAAELELGRLQELYTRECGPGSTSGPAGPFPPGAPGPQPL